MDKVGKTIAIMLIAAFAVGIVVILVRPTYRQTAVDIIKGESTNSPIWRSNEGYYPDLVPEAK